jgi:hypothetical protein
VEVLLLGDEYGTAEVAAEVGAMHSPAIDLNEFGTPRVNSLFGEAHRVAAPNSALAYVNADLILFGDFADAVTRIRLRRFLLAGRRRDLSIEGELEFAPGWEEALRGRAFAEGALRSPWGSDYFVFPSDGTFESIPPFAVGRAHWDNWMFARASGEGIPILDGTRAITAVHQAHGYEHVPGQTALAWEGPESEANRALGHELVPAEVPFHLLDATHALTARGVWPILQPRSLWRRWQSRRAWARFRHGRRIAVDAHLRGQEHDRFEERA